MTATSIEWTDVTWNPTRGCSRVSEGCRNCYAERIAARFSGTKSPEVHVREREDRFHGFARMTPQGPHWTGRVELIPSKLDEPLRWRKPRRVFVNSMSDLFHEALPNESIARVFDVMARAPQHTFQVLTKRPARMLEFCSWAAENGLGPLSNVWLGVSVEDQATADERIPLLLQTPAAVRFVSYEPALGPVNFGPWVNPMTTTRTICEPDVRWLDWLIVGGESGPGARPMDISWARSVVRQCGEAGVACFIKQLGAKPYDSTAVHIPPPELIFMKHPKGGNPAEWPEDLRVRGLPR